MAWETRGSKTYNYRSARVNGVVKKVYYGTGRAGEFAANVVALKRAERVASDDDRRRADDQLDVAIAATKDLSQRCELFAIATLLSAGFHRPARHAWRRWNHGRRVLARTAEG
jgi:hypothetical protein